MRLSLLSSHLLLTEPFYLLPSSSAPLPEAHILRWIEGRRKKVLRWQATTLRSTYSATTQLPLLRVRTGSWSEGPELRPGASETLTENTVLLASTFIYASRTRNRIRNAAWATSSLSRGLWGRDQAEEQVGVASPDISQTGRRARKIAIRSRH